MNIDATPFADRREVALALLDAGCVTARTDEPFRLPSGWASPVYMDCRRVIAFPTLRQRLVATSLAVLRAQGALDDLQGIVGAEASGIALAAWMADQLALPLQYVRKKAAGQSQIEGVLARNDKVLLVDDLIAAGHSKVRFVQALKAAGARVYDIFVVFDYATFDSVQLLAPMKVRLHALCTWHDVLAVASRDQRLPEAALLELEAFIADPSEWSQNHGGFGRLPVDAP
jgi:orotate phosphoribosyltransferase